MGSQDSFMASVGKTIWRFRVLTHSQEGHSGRECENAVTNYSSQRLEDLKEFPRLCIC